MDDLKLAKLIDGIVKQRLKEALKNDKNIKRFIKEEVKSQLITILLENKIPFSQANQKDTKGKKTAQISELLGNNKPVKYPKIQNKKQRKQVEEQPLFHTKDPVLNEILNRTPYVADSGGGYTGNALMDSMGMSAMGGGDMSGMNMSGMNMGSNMEVGVDENIAFAQSIANSMGKNVKIDIDPNALEKVKSSGPPAGAQFMTDKKTPHLKEYVGDDGFKYVDDRALFENDNSRATVPNTLQTVNLEKALNRNYKQLLGKMDEKAQKFRDRPINRFKFN